MIDTNYVAIAAIGLVGSILAIVVKPLFALLKANTQASDANTVALQEIAKETKQGNKEAKQRNGHLGDLVVQQGAAIQGIADSATHKVIQAVQHVNTQHIAKQTIDKSIVKNEKVELEIIEEKKEKK